MFPRARRLLAKDELRELGLKMKARKKALLAGGDSLSAKVSAA